MTPTEPHIQPPPEPVPAWRRGWFVPAAGLALALLSCHPLFLHLNRLGPGDWDYFGTFHDAVRKTILEHGQFPWWNPWMAGGLPLFAYAQTMTFSIWTPLAMLFGTIPGLKLTLAIHYVIGFEGARRAASRFIRNPVFQLVVAALFTWNSGQTTGGAVGQFGNITVYYLPWLVYFAVGIGRSRACAIGLGLTEGLMLLTNLHYNSVYGLLFTHIIIVLAFIHNREGRRRILLHWLLATTLCLALSGFRVWMTWNYLKDYRRENLMFIHVGLETLVRMLIQPWQTPATAPVAVLTQIGLPPTAELVQMKLAWWEVASYIGIIPIAIFLLSFRPKVRFWHAFVLVCLAFGYSSIAVWSPGTWLHQLPVFSSMWVITRWRFPAMLFLGLAVGTTLESWSGSKTRWVRRSAWGLALFIPLDLFVQSFPGWDRTFFIEPGQLKCPHPAAAHIRSYRAPDLGADRAIVEKLQPYPISSFMTWYVARNLAVIDAYETILGYKFSRETRRLWVGHPDYRGEWLVDGQPVEPQFWSPNRIVLPAHAGAEVRINQNPGCCWVVNGKRPWPNKRVFELTEDWVVTNDREGVCEIRIRPPGVSVGLLITAAGIAGFAATLAAGRVRKGSSQKGQDDEPAGRTPGTMV